MDAKDYIRIFEQSPALMLVIDTSFIIIAASDDFIKKTKTTREFITGQNIFYVFPSNPDNTNRNEESTIRASFNRVIKNKTADTLPVIRYDIPKPASEGGGFETKYWKVVNSPILDDNNNVQYIIQRSDDVTENKTLVAQLDAEQKAIKQLEESEKRYNMMLLKSPFGFAILKGKNMVITLANDSVKEMWGKGKDLEGKTLLEVLPEIKDSEFPDLLDKVYTSGTPFCGDEVLCPVFRNGKLEDVYFNFVYQPYLEADETISGITIIAYEVTTAVIVKNALAALHNADQKALKKIEEISNRYYMMLMDSPFAFCVMKGKDMMVTLANDLMKDFWGKGKDVEGKKLLEILPEIKDQPFPEMIEKVYITGIPFYANEILGKVTYNGKLKHKYFNVVFQPYYDADNSISGVTQIAYEVTEMVMARKKIEESDKRYNMMLMNSPFTFAVLKGKDLTIELANDQIKEVWGRGNDIEGKSLLEIMPELKNTTFLDMLDEVRATGIPFHGIEVQSPKNMHGTIKEEYFFNFVFQPYLEADQTISGITIIGNEVTDQVIAKRGIIESERNLRQILDSMPQKITNADTEGNVIYFNKKWLDDTGLEFEKLKGWGWEKVIHPDDLEMTITNWSNSFKTGEIFDMECRILNKHGAYKWHLSRALPIKDEHGKIKMWVGTNTDIHEQKDAKYKAETAQIAAEDAMQAKQQFLSNMSHEIRTPMNAIIGFTNVLLKSKLDKSQEDYLTAIKDSGDALLVLINDILDLAKVDAGKMTFEQTSFNLADSLSSMLQLFDMKIKEKNLELITQFDTAIPEIIMGDSIRLRQIILNLISNAVKFTNAGKITICVSLLKQDTEEITIEFTITDTGIGIHKTKLEHIFEDFGQATYENSRLYGGTGLGLTIVKKLIEQQGGTIRVESELGKGSAFSFQLNFAKTNQKIEQESEPVSNTQAEVKKINILVAEDMPLNQLLIKIILADFGFDVDIAGNGKIAIEKLEQNKYDLVLMDLQMPEMNGFDATAYVRNIMKSDIPIIALTADVTSVDLEKAQAMGMNDYVSKPVDEQLLYSKIIKALQKTD
ncbi:PAS domain S-box protein [Flavobacterium tiangeerense]|uniref:PAS domain S-box protein n=1 Tax=Flavobacterium tiangeerense TaxID=459471 RepID=UPI0011A1E642|nr:PAS domain S-box protein [Flavobacterium tiangeerense]